MPTLRKLLVKAIEGQNEIRKVLSPDVIRKAQAYDNLIAYLKKVRLEVKSALPTIDEKGMSSVIITYAPIVETVRFENGRMEGSETFKAINGLDITTSKGLTTIRKALEAAQAENIAIVDDIKK